MPHLHIYSLLCCYLLLFEEKEIPPKTQHIRLLSACNRWGTAWKAGNSLRIPVAEPRLSYLMIPVLSLQRFSPPSIFLCLHCELFKAFCKIGVLPSQPSIEGNRNGCTAGLLQPLYIICREPTPFCEPRNSQLAVWVGEEHEPVMFSSHSVCFEGH